MGTFKKLHKLRSREEHLSSHKYFLESIEDLSLQDLSCFCNIMYSMSPEAVAHPIKPTAASKFLFLWEKYIFIYILNVFRQLKS